MIKKFQSSFNRILLSRILLLTISGLVLGQYIIYRQARSTLLKTARQNLKESAERKAQYLQQWATSLKSSLVSASESYVLESGTVEEYQSYIKRLHEMLSTQISCVQLSNLQTEQIVANTCGTERIDSLPENIWPQQQKQLVRDKYNIYVSYTILELLSADSESNAQEVNQKTQVNLVWSVPVYVSEAGERKLRYALSIKSALPMPTKRKKGSFTGSTVVINLPEYRILASLDSRKLGRRISELSDTQTAQKLESIIKKAKKGQKHFAHISSIEETDTLSKNQGSDRSKNTFREIIDKLKKILPKLLRLKLSEDNEFLAGYVAIPSPIDRDNDKVWVVLAITPIDFALSGLIEVQKVLIILILFLLGASIIASIFLARDLAIPLKKLRDYAITVNDLNAPSKVPQDLKIREFNQLAVSLQKMVERLNRWADKIEVASKEAQVANQLKSEFLANISHELRTPLNGIIGSLQIIYDGFCDTREEEIQFLKQANDSAIHLLRIIDDILDIRKIDARNLYMTFENINIIKLLEETVDIFRYDLEQKSLVFKLNTSEEKIIVYVDKKELQKVFENVISNAIKFTEKGNIDVSICRKYNQCIFSENQNNLVNAHTHKVNQVLVTIQDTGIGIDPEEQDKLFQPFVMVDGTKTRKFGGNGLGLAMARGLVEMMNGNIHLYSEGIGRGTTVYITIPIQERLSLEKKQDISTEIKLN